MSRSLKRPAVPLGAVVSLVLVIGLLGVGGWSSPSAASPPVSSAVLTSTAPATGKPVPSAGCAAVAGSSAIPPVTNLQQTLEVDGVSRWYLLNLPASTTPSPTPPAKGGNPADVPRPLVLDFHGLAEGANLHSTTSQFGTLGQQDGFIAVFPNGTGTPVQWNTTAQTHNPDLDFVTALLAHLESTLCIDTSRVYASGFSDGSFMVSLLACTMSNQFAAIAAVSGLQLDKPCRTTRRVPILTFHGTADPILYFNGGIGTATLKKLLGGKTTGSSTPTKLPKVKLHGAGYPATVQAWAVKDGCNAHSTDTRLSSQVILRHYACPARTDVEFYIILGGGHAWPGSKISQAISSLTGYTTFQIKATPTIWSFFQRFQL
jgi:polyhydroxybutyrate depolymerase